MGALPRPFTPGPWRVEGDMDDIDHDVMTDDGTGIASYVGPMDAAAIAALPERIAREDRVREVCARWIDEGDLRPGIPEYLVQRASNAAHILRILDGEGGA